MNPTRDTDVTSPAVLKNQLLMMDRRGCTFGIMKLFKRNDACKSSSGVNNNLEWLGQWNHSPQCVVSNVMIRIDLHCGSQKD